MGDFVTLYGTNRSPGHSGGTMSNDDKKFILEHFDDKFAVLVESLGVMIENKVRPIVQEELAEVKQDMKIVKLAVVQTNKDLKKLEERVTKFEKTVFA